MTDPAPLNLLKLPLLGELFAFLNGGKHLNRLSEPKLWAELERERGAYHALFTALGYCLRVDGRGFAWFHHEDASSGVSKTTRQLALLFMLIFEYQADVGLQLGRFTDWLIDDNLLTSLIEKNRLLLEAEGLAEAEQLTGLLKTSANYGFATTEGSAWRLLPAVFRYLDRFEELARDEDSQEASAEEDVGEQA